MKKIIMDGFESFPRDFVFSSPVSVFFFQFSTGFQFLFVFWYGKKRNHGGNFQLRP